MNGRRPEKCGVKPGGARGRAGLRTLFQAILFALWLYAVSRRSGSQLAYIGPGAGFAFLGSFLSLLIALALSIASLLLWPLRAARRLVANRRAYGRARVRKLIFLGLDGLDPGVTERLMDEGKLPNLARLRERGSFRRLRTTFPSLSPVAWSTFATGVSPAKHNIFDFLNRSLKSYLPELAPAKVSPPARVWRIGRFRIPLSRPRVELRRKSEPFWRILSRYGVQCTILRVPVTFPPEKFDGRQLSAMCTPDLKGTQGSFSQFTTALAEANFEGGSRYPLKRAGADLEGELEGPDDPLRDGAGPLRIPFRITPGENGAALRIAGQTILLRTGEYSPWVKLVFRSAPGVKAKGIARFLVTAAAPEFTMYVTPVQIDPEDPALPISQPSCYAVYLAKLVGLYATAGLAEDTWALNEGVLDERGFLEQAWSIHREREAMFLGALERTRHGVVACVFDASDRIQHMFYRKADGAAIEDMYRRMDELVGKTLRHADGRTAVFVLSDHGFRAFRRGVNLNTWLLRNGYLALKNGRSEGGRYFEGVDWSRTRAYTVGLAGLYLNLKGREAQGIVEPGAEALALTEELIAKLTGLPDAGAVAIRSVYASRSLYHGPYIDAAPDLIVGYNDGYRTSWDAAVGKTGAAVIEDNDKAWSGDHCVDPPLVPGVLFSNLPVRAEDPGIEDMAATALALFGIPRPAWMEGKCVLD